MKKKAYLIKGSRIEESGKKEWIEKITISKIKAEKFKKDLNNSLLKDIVKGKEVFDLYMKDKDIKKPWEKMEFHVEKMNDKEFLLFHTYRYGTALPFKIEEVYLS